MNRRDVLKRAAAVGVVGAIAGCTSQRETPGDGSDDGDGETTTTTTEAFSITSRSVDSSGTCGQENRASIAFEDGVVRITGAIPASDPCHEATMTDSTYGEGSGELAVSMGVSETDADMCEQCLARVEYEATIEHSGSGPGRVSVSHGTPEGEETVATAENDS